MSVLNFAQTALVAVTCASLAACASTKVDTKTLAASTKAIADGDMAEMDCEALKETHLGLAENIAGATVKPNAVDYTDASQVSKAKDLSGTQTAASVGLTAVKSIIPGAGFAPLISGSAFRSAARSEALGEANVKLARMEGVMLAKGCNAMKDDDEQAENALEEDVEA